MTFEGDQSIPGDQLLFKAGAGAEVPLADAANSATNFFNGSRTAFGAGVGFPGDLPRFDGKPGSLSGLDIDIVDISANLSAGLTSATLTAKTTNDVFALGGFVTSIATYQPDFSTSTKTVTNLTRQDGTNQPGDVLEYTIIAKNTGSDASKATILRDVLPAGVSYEAGSIKVVDGANGGAKTDPAADDQGEYDAATSTVTVRLGTGATAAVGGQIDVGSQSTVSLRVKVKPGGDCPDGQESSVHRSGGGPRCSGGGLAVVGERKPERLRPTDRRRHRPVRKRCRLQRWVLPDAEAPLRLFDGLPKRCRVWKCNLRPDLRPGA